MSSAFSDSAEEPLEPREQEQHIPEDVPIAGAETLDGGSEEADSPITDTLPSPSPEELLPPEARGEANGGPLGCCLGIVVGLLLTALLSTGLSLALANGGTLSFATIPVLFIGTVLGGYLGWRIGKRVYKEYELSPRQKRKLAQQQRRLEQMERKEMERKRKRQSSTI